MLSCSSIIVMTNSLFIIKGQEMLINISVFWYISVLHTSTPMLVDRSCPWGNLAAITAESSWGLQRRVLHRSKHRSLDTSWYFSFATLYPLLISCPHEPRRESEQGMDFTIHNFTFYIKNFPLVWVWVLEEEMCKETEIATRRNHFQGTVLLWIKT